jgi:hypothetical protein
LAAEPRQDLPIPLPVTLTRPGGVEETVYAVNLSVGGLCLHLREPLRTGDVVGVDFRLPPDGPQVTCSAHVIWCGGVEPGASGTGHAETGLRFEKLEEPVRQALYHYAIRPADSRR